VFVEQNLNLIERLWKLVKAEVLNAAYHGTFDEFKSVIDSFITRKREENIKRKFPRLYLITFNYLPMFLYLPHNDIFMDKGV
jgi:hypothetical protein